MNRIDLKGRFAVVTGGAGGIGAATAERFRQSGATVAIWEHSAELAERASQISQGTIAFVVDVTDEESVVRAAEDTLDAFGRIDILVNAAGITNPRTLVKDYPLDLWNRIIMTNLTGTFLCCRAVLPAMLDRDYGRIVNLGSVSGKDGNPFSSAYSASKAGVHSLTKSLGKELAQTGIRVNAVAPAIIATDNLYHAQPEEMRKLWVSRVPMGRPGKAEEVAAMIAWLASEECSYSTGALFDLSGGRATY